jgi:hypothetical protein
LWNVAKVFHKAQHTISPSSKEVNNYLVACAYIISPKKSMYTLKVPYMLVLDINGLLCVAHHVKNASKTWKPLVPIVHCGQKLVSYGHILVSFLNYVLPNLTLGFGLQQQSWIWSPRLNLSWGQSQISNMCLCGGRKSVKWLQLVIHNPRLTINAKKHD